eukprot:TRINITY_DN19699_c0_g1_i1.p1 TRINITY_DN19699_c0_g1~~TRINITY_DN19699_c0_g1_i1.p1  ORF type:complete len:354 (+),score=38.12 TRINITY_DN19699_c0_g1_i1:55-1116(+)
MPRTHDYSVLLGLGSQPNDAAAAHDSQADVPYLHKKPLRSSFMKQVLFGPSDVIKSAPSTKRKDPLAQDPDDYQNPASFPENRGKTRPGKKPEKCQRGEDFSQPCPRNWTFVRAGPNGSECQAPPNFWTANWFCQQKMGARQVLPGMLETYEKREISKKCWTQWPCKELEQDFTEPCPIGWSWLANGKCAAPINYHGSCPWEVNLLMYTPGMKATFAKNCGAAWPLAPKFQPPKPLPPPAHSPQHAPGEKPSWQCKHDFRKPCPEGFSFDGYYCHAGWDYEFRESLGCSKFDPRRWTDEMKEAFGKHCHVWWPCVQAPYSPPQAARRMAPLVLSSPCLREVRRPRLIRASTFL